MYKQAAQAYQKTSQVAVSPRELEATLLMKAAARLQLIKDEWDNSSLAEIDDALTYNRKLWTILVTSVTNPENPCPTRSRTTSLRLVYSSSSTRWA